MTKIFQEKLTATLDEFGIKASWLSERSGVSQQAISRYRTGVRDIYVESFAKIFLALPIEAKQSLLEQLLGGAIAPSLTPALVINQLDPDNPAHRKQAADAFRLIGEKFVYPDLVSAKKTSETTDEGRELATLPS